MPKSILLNRAASFIMVMGLSWSIINGTCLAQDAPPSFPNNSTKKIRTRPSAQSKRIGSAVHWQPDFASAIAKSKETGKPIFWYVPTLEGTFMDRQPEIHRYMMAGPFSWPAIIEVINENFVPVKTAPTPEQQEKYVLVPYQFVEPGFLILQPNGEASTRVDRITTMHPDWFRKLLTRSLKHPSESMEKPEILEQAWELFRDRDYHAALKRLADSKSSIESLSQSEQSECALLMGMAYFRSGQHDRATETWKLASEQFVDEPLAWKAAAESQRIGPFVRGFEVHHTIPDAAMNAGIASAGSAAPAGTYTESQLWKSGVEYLLGMQNHDGVFTDSDYDFGGTDSLPNVHAAVTSLAGMALLKAHQQNDLSSETKTRITEAINRIVSFVSDDSNIAKSDKDEILWAYAYRLRFLARCLTQEEIELDIDKADLEQAIAAATKSLEEVQSERGGWYHEYNNSFVTATALIALHEAQQSGAVVDLKKIEMGLASLARDRFGNAAYPYSSRRRNRNAPMPGTPRDIAASAGRMPICELALWKWGKSTDEAVSAAITQSLNLHGNLSSALKYDDHTSNLAYGGFFFWYDMRGRAEAIANVKETVLQAEFKAQHRALILALPELDGCFVDSHELGRVYGTAMALLSLDQCR